MNAIQRDLFTWDLPTRQSAVRKYVTEKNPYVRKASIELWRLLQKQPMSEGQFFGLWANESKKAIELSRLKGRESYRRHSERRVTDARQQRARRRLNPEKLEKNRKYVREKARQRIANEPEYLVRKKIRTRIVMAIQRTGTTKKSIGTETLIGCTLPEVRRHIESLWKPGMNWENYGRYGWHIDHIKPCASFDLTNVDEQKKCFHFSNMQPLWEFDNLSKGAKIL